MLTVDQFETLEAIIDKNSVRDVIGAIELICAGKAAHLRNNWQDRTTARQWDRDANALRCVIRQLTAY